MPINSRAKGATGERQFANTMNSLLGGQHFVRNLEQSRSGGADFHPVGRCAVEVKRGETPRWAEWLRQAQAQAGGAFTPVLAWRANQQPWQIWVCMSPPEFAAWLIKCRQAGDPAALHVALDELKTALLAPPVLCAKPVSGHHEGACTRRAGHEGGCFFPNMWNDM